MIGHLKGTVLSIEQDTAIIDVAGVGYEVHATSRLLDRLMPGEAASLSIDTMVREDFIKLYAFGDAVERQCFRLLQSVQGVGAKAAIAILQVLTPSQLLDAISVSDDAAIARAQGVGKKIATRICSELQGKTVDLMAMVAGRQGLGKTLAGGADTPSAAAGGNVTEIEPAPATGVKADAVSALANLGYDSVSAREAVVAASKQDSDADVQTLIKLALKELGSNS
jgi:Holliday junction DNA helicase RuvA